MAGRTRMFAALSVVIAVAIIAFLLLAHRGGGRSSPVTSEPPTALTRHTGKWNFEGVALCDALNSLARHTHTTIFLHRHDLEQHSLKPAAPVFLGFGDKPLGKALALIFASVADPEMPLVAWEEGGVVHVATRACPRQAIIRAYDVADIVQSWAVPDDEESTAPNGTFSGQASPVGVFGGAGFTLSTRMDMLMRLIEDGVDPQGWREMGGPFASLRETLDTLLIVRQSGPRHRQIDRLLAALRSALQRVTLHPPVAGTGNPLPPDSDRKER